MAKSIKLNDDVYIDTTGVYDSTLNKTQREINRSLMEYTVINVNKMLAVNDTVTLPKPYNAYSKIVFTVGLSSSSHHAQQVWFPALADNYQTYFPYFYNNSISSAGWVVQGDGNVIKTNNVNGSIYLWSVALFE